MFVVAIDPEERAVIIGTADELLGHEVVLEEVNWLSGQPLVQGETCDVQVRYRAAAARATVAQTKARGRQVTLRLDEPVRAITPGQSGVLYRGAQVLGGGIIGSPRSSPPRPL